jgi:hypothetical protein
MSILLQSCYMMNRLFFLLGLLIYTTVVQAQIREGLVKYSMTVEGDESGMANPLLGNSSVNVYFKQDRTVMEMASPLYNMRTISDSKNVLVLMDAMGQKSFTRSSKAEADKQKKQDWLQWSQNRVHQREKENTGLRLYQSIGNLSW